MDEIKLIYAGKENSVYEAVIPGEGLVRRILPASVEEQSIILEADFDKGIPYGLPFDEIFKVDEKITEEISSALHNAGIWTFEDLRTHAREAVGALQSVYGIELGTLIKNAEAYENAMAEKPAAAPKKTKTSG